MKKYIILSLFIALPVSAQVASTTVLTPFPGVTITNSACNPDVVTWQSQFACENYIRKGGSGMYLTPVQTVNIGAPIIDESTTTVPIVSVATTTESIATTTDYKIQEMQTLIGLLTQLVQILTAQLAQK